MTDSCLVLRGGSYVTWPRMSTTIVPCRIGDERTFAEPSDPQDANTRAQSEWAITMPWDFPLEVGDACNITLIETGALVNTIVGETNAPQTWITAMRGYGTKPKSSVAVSLITFKRDADNDGEYELTLGSYDVQVVFERTDPQEIPLRYAEAGRSSYVPVRITILEPDANVMTDDIFLLDGHYGVVRSVVPGQPQQTELRAFVDFGGIY